MNHTMDSTKRCPACADDGCHLPARIGGGVSRTLEAFWWAQAEWSESVFGTTEQRGPKGPLKHLVKEVEKELLPELEQGKTPDIVEFADLLFLVFDSTRRAGYTFDQLRIALFYKLAVNRARTWPQTSPEEPVEHVRKRKKSEVLAAQSSVMGCCDRHADNMACDCLEEAEEG